MDKQLFILYFKRKFNFYKNLFLDRKKFPFNLFNTSTDINRNNLHLYENFYAIIKFSWEITSVVIPVKVKKVSLEPSPSLSLKSNPKPSVALATL